MVRMIGIGVLPAARLALVAFVMGTLALRAQTTQGLISGRITDSVTGATVANAEIRYFSLNTNASGTIRSGASGYYVAAALSPGLYRVRVASAGYQAQEVHNLELAVSARLDLSFALRPLSDVWESGQYRSIFLPGSDAILTFYGPDVDTSRFVSFAANQGTTGALETSVSQVIDPALIRELPLAGRDVYTMLVTQPGVTADAGTTRGLGISANGQRPSATNYLLDGVESNNYLVTGPLTAVAPEAVQEYRVSTNNFSAEYGRTSGFLANAVTRSGGAAWHGLGYFYLKNDALNANSFQRNLAGLPRTPQKEAQGGYQAGGRIPGTQSLFLSSSLERLRTRSQTAPVDFRLPTSRFTSDFTAPGSTARKILTQYAPPPVTDRNLPTAILTIAPPVSINRWLALERLDYKPAASRHQVMGRFSLSRLDRPDFIYSPYPDFVSGLTQNTYSVAVQWQTSIKPRLINEARLGWGRDELRWDRAHPEVATLLEGFEGTTLPGSLAFYEFRSPNSSWEFNDTLTWAQGRHIVKAGGGLLWRKTDTALTAGRDGMYQFLDIIDFALDEPSFLFAPLSRGKLPGFNIPNYNRLYRQNQLFFFAQDTLRVNSRFTVNFGMRYENAGAPSNTGAE
ncbi:MAG: TonB-dependent receptor, partial [Acidobacteriia bacterium]|nr:TonB-dependent receptor [Terriglobia bacterium]